MLRLQPRHLMIQINKKKYLLREIEREEAEKEIFIAKRKQLTNDPPEVSEVQRMDETNANKF